LLIINFDEQLKNFCSKRTRKEEKEKKKKRKKSDGLLLSLSL
jgi:hypothetical protein